MTGVRPALVADLAAVQALLVAAGLPLDGLEDRFPEGYAVAEGAGGLVGAEGVETYGAAGLLRSVVVAPAGRGTGLGKTLVADRLAWAARAGLAELYLLTTTAPDFFQARGFARVAREAAPEGIRGSREFREVCAASSVLMRLRLEA